jgi:hypothetical protein
VAGRACVCGGISFTQLQAQVRKWQGNMESGEKGGGGGGWGGGGSGGVQTHLQGHAVGRHAVGIYVAGQICLNGQILIGPMAKPFRQQPAAC